MGDEFRANYIQACKDLSFLLLNAGDLPNAVVKMIDNMNKHPECKVNEAIITFGLLAIQNNDRQAAFRFIDGFR